MAKVFTVLLGVLLGGTGSWVGRVLTALGVGYVSYTGVSAGITAVKAQVVSYLSGAPATMVTIMGLLKVDVAVSVIFSAFAARLVLRGLSAAGTFTKAVIK